MASPLDTTKARRIAFSGVPLEIWWSTKDKVVVDQSHNSEELLARIIDDNPHAPVIGVVGTWDHTAEMWYDRRLPAALAAIGLLPVSDAHPFAPLRPRHANVSPQAAVA